MNPLHEQAKNPCHILLGVCGGVAAYKAAELLRLLTSSGHQVRVVMTDSAQQFVAPLTFAALSGSAVYSGLFDPQGNSAMDHIELARWAHVVLIAPATANCLARLAHGFADDLLSTICLATQAPIVLAPAMNQAMWAHPATQSNVTLLKERGLQVWGPSIGLQACGDHGPGRMLEPIEIAEQLNLFLTSKHVSNAPLLKGHKVIVTAGPTREALDPVRFISNHSSGKMGYALAHAAAAAGADVVLISGPVTLAAPSNVTCLRIESAAEMLQACLAHIEGCSIFIAAAAVADFCLAVPAEQKHKKNGNQTWSLQLIPTPDIVATISGRSPKPFTVGFAAETEALLEHAQQKLLKKNLDLIIANDVADPSIGFNSDENAVTLIDHQGTTTFSKRSKTQLASDLVAAIASRLPPPSRTHS